LSLALDDSEVAMSNYPFTRDVRVAMIWRSLPSALVFFLEVQCVDPSATCKNIHHLGTSCSIKVVRLGKLIKLTLKWVALGGS
jgi:hypothetical protein